MTKRAASLQLRLLARRGLAVAPDGSLEARRWCDVAVVAHKLDGRMLNDPDVLAAEKARA